MKVDAAKKTIALNLAVVCADQRIADRFVSAMAALMGVPDRLAPSHTGGRVDAKLSTVHQVLQKGLSLAAGDAAWKFELFFTGLTPQGAKEFNAFGGELAKERPVDATLQIFPQMVEIPDPGLFLRPVLHAVTPVLVALHKPKAPPPSAPPKKKSK